MGDRRTHINNCKGVFYTASAENNRWASQRDSSYGNYQGVGFNASGSSGIYQDNSNVVPSSVQVIMCIKY